MEKAINLIGKFLVSHPDDFEKIVILANAYQQKGDLETAIELYNQAGKLKPASTQPNLHLSFIFRQRNQLDEAVSNLKDALKKSPKSLFIANNLAMVLLERGNSTDIEEAFSLASILRSKHKFDPVIADTFGNALFLNGDIERAVDVLKNAIELDPFYPPAHFHLAQVYAKQNELLLANNSIKRALQLSDNFDGVNEAIALLAEIQNTLQ